MLWWNFYATREQPLIESLSIMTSSILINLLAFISYEFSFCTFMIFLHLKFWFEMHNSIAFVYYVFWPTSRTKIWWNIFLIRMRSFLINQIDIHRRFWVYQLSHSCNKETLKRSSIGIISVSLFSSKNMIYRQILALLPLYACYAIWSVQK